MNIDNFTRELFAIVDSMNGGGLAARITENGIFRFANIPGVQGREAIAAFLDNFFASIKAIRHDQLESWQSGDTRFATGRVTYTRHNGTSMSVPFANILKMKGDLVDEYLIFVDASGLYQ